MNAKVKGYLCGIVAAISYGTNPLGALFLYRDGLNAFSVLFYRYLIAIAVLGVILAVRKRSFRVSGRELALLAFLGVMFAVSSISLFVSFNHIDAGIASTLLFVYPVMVAVLMALLFKERITFATILSIATVLCGVVLLYRGDGNATLNPTGVGLVMLSSLSYAVYIIAINRIHLNIPPLKVTFYVLLFGILTIVVGSFFGNDTRLQLLTTPAQWGYASILALLPTVVSLVLMTEAINLIGSTPAAIMGALEPMTAVLIGVTVFGESFTSRLALGIILILAGVIIITVGESFSPKKSLLRHTAAHK